MTEQMPFMLNNTIYTQTLIQTQAQAPSMHRYAKYTDTSHNSVVIAAYSLYNGADAHAYTDARQIFFVRFSFFLLSPTLYMCVLNANPMENSMKVILM